MLAALREKRIAGAAFDVYHHEPLQLDDPLMKMDNVVKLPHIGGATADVVRHHSVLAKQVLDPLAAGLKPPFIFNPEVLESTRLRMHFKAQ